MAAITGCVPPRYLSSWLLRRAPPCRRLSRSTSRAWRASSLKLVALNTSLSMFQSRARIALASITSRKMVPEPSSRRRIREASVLLLE
ncbi:hypothetical protein D3C80_1690520 [compost metagenome]